MEERNEDIPKDTENKAQETILDKNESNMADASPRESDEDASTKETGASEENSGENMVGQANESQSNTEPEVENDDEEKALGAIEATVDSIRWFERAVSEGRLSSEAAMDCVIGQGHHRVLAVKED